MTHTLQIRVYYEDTDMAGIVYYANYLKFIERGRSEWVRELGVDQGQLKAEGGGVFAVRRVVAEYRAPAIYDDLLDVQTRYISHSGARLVLHQAVLRGGKLLFEAEVTLVCISDARRPIALPHSLTRHFGENPPQHPE
ncbi:MAG: tol-pal system-associated acyl-CoA thioesterase [Rhodobacteraceae bacterium]|nr:tol-pal system-associated acyl-CoA thioesterase [Paracoccaceae bacterium]